ncbi:MAG: Transcriptional repressor NrdR [Parcubacteria group bacterium GW2011_GWA2_47_7]|nr:MAG: Transcriptional repressor NrdR [Parcubacteria group bacterium GW2011_GWA2_47_7]
MDCPHCKTKNTQVENSRETKGGSAIWRRRKCMKCKKVFSTYESPGLDYLIIEKRNGKHTRYLSHKLFASIYDAVSEGKHKDRGDSAMLAHEVLGIIEQQMLVSQKESIKATEIIDMATDTLETRDLGACYRYAAFAPYRGMKFGI